MHQQAFPFFHRGSEIANGRGVEQSCQRKIIFSCVHIGIGGAIDNDVDPLVLHEGTNSGRIGDVELSRLDVRHIVDVSKDIVVGGSFGNNPQLAAELSVGSRDKNVHGFG